MYTIPQLIMKALQITLTDIILSGDNVGVIALAIRDLPPKKAKQAGAMGVAAALVLRMIFVALVSFLFTIDWLHVNLFGGLILLYITYNMIKDEEKVETGVKKPCGSLFKAVLQIVVADISMSLDNVLAIAAIAIQDGGGKLGPQEMGLVIFGLACCLPIIFFGSGLVAKLMKKFPIIIYICAGLLVYTAMSMIFKDGLIRPIILSVSANFGMLLSAVCGAAVIVYGIYLTMKVSRKAVK